MRTFESLQQTVLIIRKSWRLRNTQNVEESCIVSFFEKHIGKEKLWCTERMWVCLIVVGLAMKFAVGMTKKFKAKAGLYAKNLF